MNPSLRASLIVILAASLPALTWAKSSDRNQAMNIDAGGQSGTIEGSGTTVLSGGVIVQQGTLDVRSDRGEITMRDNEIARVVFTGSPATLKQQMEDGSPMTATANRIDYDTINEVVTFTGNYTVKSPKGSNSGQKMVYNLKTGNMQSGGDGTRVKTVIQPKSAAAKKPEGSK
ncbi:lipopolysaccharide transport periplasmic protein LptA [Pseudoxanthomonas yeongjuensis]|nr:lipopolysaccharide transport periplasmic protein LptA [Pseudoxanthomonas yeongjuensis]KAF1718514.1 lipopolysaccharide transport periplasmic protein LptA [Pseudoxanthomonas yeongjuensis]